MNDNQKVRNHLVFLFNYALDIKNKRYIDGDDLMYFSNDVKKFKQDLNNFNIDKEIYSSLQRHCPKFCVNIFQMGFTVLQLNPFFKYS